MKGEHWWHGSENITWRICWWWIVTLQFEGICVKYFALGDNFHALYCLTLDLFYLHIIIMLCDFWLTRVTFLFQLSSCYQSHYANILTFDKMFIYWYLSLLHQCSCAMTHILQKRLLTSIHHHCINVLVQWRIFYNKGFILIIGNVAELLVIPF